MTNIRQICAEQFDYRSMAAGSKAHYLVRFSDDEPDAGAIPAVVVKGEREGPTLLVLAAVHGDEYEGVRALIELLRAIKPNDVLGTLVAVPIANKSAYANGTRESAADGLNLARAFPGDPQGTYTRKLAWTLREKFISRADFLLDLHSGGTHYAMPPLVGYYHDPDSEAGRRSRTAAEAFGMNTIWGHSVIAPGRTISAAQELGIPWLYTEGYGGQRIREDELRLYYDGVLRLLQHLNMLAEPQRWLSAPFAGATHRYLGDGNLDRSATARLDGFFVPAVRFLQQVEAGERIGGIYDCYGQEQQSVISEHAGHVMMLREVPYTRKGDPLYVLATARL